MGGNHKNFDVLDLIVKVRHGDDSAFEKLLLKYHPLIEASVSRSLGEDFYSLYADDFRQEATVVFYNAVLNYDLDQAEVEFGLFAKICISNALRSQLRLLKKRRSERLSETSDEDLYVDDCTDPSEIVLEQEKLISLYSVIRDSLSDFEYRVWRMYISGMSAKKIGLLMNKDEKSVCNAIYRIRKKLRAQLQ